MVDDGDDETTRGAAPAAAPGRTTTSGGRCSCTARHHSSTRQYGYLAPDASTSSAARARSRRRRLRATSWRTTRCSRSSTKTPRRNRACVRVCVCSERRTEEEICVSPRKGRDMCVCVCACVGGWVGARAPRALSPLFTTRSASHREVANTPTALPPCESIDRLRCAAAARGWANGTVLVVASGSSVRGRTQTVVAARARRRRRRGFTSRVRCLGAPFATRGTTLTDGGVARLLAGLFRRCRHQRDAAQPEGPGLD